MNWFDTAKERLALWKEQSDLHNSIFTPPALRVFQRAREEASGLNQNYIGVEHLLLSLLKSGNGIACEILRKMGLTLESVRSEVAAMAGRGVATKTYPLFTPRAKNIIDAAKKEADVLGYQYVGTEHLLLGLLLEKSGPTFEIFKKFKVNPEEVRIQLLNNLMPIPPISPDISENKNQVV